MAEDALSKAKAIAAKLGGSFASDLGKRKDRWGDDANAGVGLLQKKKVYIPVNEYPNINFLGLLIGPRGATQKHLQESSGAKILIRGRGAHKDGSLQATHPDDDDDMHVYIEGTEESVKKAESEVQQILFNPDQAMKLKDSQLQSLAEMNGQLVALDECQIEVRVPNNMVGLVIGKGGENIHRMQMLSGAHMQIAKENEMKPGETQRSIWIKGDSKAVADLKSRVEDIVNSRLNQTNQAQKVPQNKEHDYAFVIKLPVPNDKVGFIIGKGGATIKGIQEKTHANVMIPLVPDEDNPNVRTLSIGAESKESADACQMEIFLVLQSQQQLALNQQSSLANAIHVTVPDDKVGLVIGKGGQTIKDIQSRCNVKIQVPHSPDAGNPLLRTLSIVGAPEAQRMARYEVELVVSGQNHISTLSSAGPLPLTNTFYDMPQHDVPTDPTAYYKDFWLYASYYGVDAARAYYGAWAPPESDCPSARPELKSTQPTEAATNDAWEVYQKQYAEWYEAYGKSVGADPHPPHIQS